MNPNPAARAGRADSGWLKRVVLLSPMVLLGMAPAALGPVLAEVQREFSGFPGSAYLVPMVLTLPSVCIALLSGLAGIMVDRLGRKTVLVFGLFLYGVAGVAPFFLTSLPAILASRIFVGIAEACAMIAATTLIGDEYEGEERERMLAYQIAVAALSAVTIAAASGVLGSFGWRYAILPHSLSLAVCCLAIALIREPQRPTRAAASSARKPAEPFPWQSTLMAGGLMLMTSLFFFIMPVELAFILTNVGITSPEVIGLTLAGVTIGLAVGAMLYKALSRYNTRVHIALGFAIMAIGLAGVAGSRSHAVITGFAFLSEIGGGMMVPSLLAAALQLFSFEHRGFGTGLVQSSNSLGQFACGVVVTGLAAATTSLTTALWILAGWAAVVSILAGLTLLRRPATAHAPGLMGD